MSELRVVCVHHRDADGYCAAAIVNKKHPAVTFIGMQHGEPILWDRLIGQHVVMVDFCFQPWEEMLRLIKEVKSLVWIDHHQTAFDELKAYIQSKEVNTVNFKTRLHLVEDRLEAVLEIGRAGCELTWEYFFPGQSEPALVHHIGRYDVWDHRDPVTKDVRAGLLARDIDPKVPVAAVWWQWALAGDTFEYGEGPVFSDLAKEGRVIRAFQRREWRRACEHVRIIVVDPQQRPWVGIGCVAVINATGNFDVFESLDPESFNVGVLFHWTGRHWSFGLYTQMKDVDVGAIAKHYGGGGHRNAAGFQSSRIPDWLLPPVTRNGV